MSESIREILSQIKVSADTSQQTKLKVTIQGMYLRANSEDEQLIIKNAIDSDKTKQPTLSQEIEDAQTSSKKLLLALRALEKNNNQSAGAILSAYNQSILQSKNSISSRIIAAAFGLGGVTFFVGIALIALASGGIGGLVCMAVGITALLMTAVMIGIARQKESKFKFSVASPKSEHFTLEMTPTVTEALQQPLNQELTTDREAEELSLGLEQEVIDSETQISSDKNRQMCRVNQDNNSRFYTPTKANILRDKKNNNGVSGFTQGQMTDKQRTVYLSSGR